MNNSTRGGKYVVAGGVFVAVIGFFGVLAGSARAESSCTPFTSVVSSMAGMPIDGGSAVRTYDQSPFWAPAFPGAEWIWKSFYAANPNGTETTVFTKTFSLTGDPTSSTLLISADDYFKATINGTEVASEFGEGNFLGNNVHEYHTPSLFKKGENTLMFEVANAPYFYQGQGTPENNPAGLLFWLAVSGNTCVDSQNTNTSGSGNGGGSGSSQTISSGSDSGSLSGGTDWSTGSEAWLKPAGIVAGGSIQSGSNNNSGTAVSETTPSASHSPSNAVGESPMPASEPQAVSTPDPILSLAAVGALPSHLSSAWNWLLALLLILLAIVCLWIAVRRLNHES